MKNALPTDSATILEALRTGTPDAFEQLYTSYRKEFFSWAGRRFEAGRQDMEDAWQDAVIALHRYVHSGKLTEINCEIRTWLFAVGYKRLLNQKRKTKRIVWKDHIDDSMIQAAIPDEQAFSPHADGWKQRHLQSAMKSISPRCRELLVQRYYMQKAISEIQEERELLNANTTSATLSRCLKRLKDIILTNVLSNQNQSSSL